MNTITPAELKNKLESSQPLQLIDVRERYEHEMYNIGGTLIPLAEIMDKGKKIPKDVPVILYCKMGIRSQIAIQRLEEKYGFTNLLNLQGGMERWKREIDLKAS
jgi:adenylyltransferase/sulfurtransferase